MDLTAATEGRSSSGAVCYIGSLRQLAPIGQPVSIYPVSSSGELGVTLSRLNSRNLNIVRSGPRTIALVNNRVVDPGRARATARVVNEREQHAARAKSGVALEKTLRSPMPGRIVKVYVKAGDTVEIGAPLLVVEAMKMENELRAKASAVVDTVLVSAGQTVEMNAVLLQLR